MVGQENARYLDCTGPSEWLLPVSNSSIIIIKFFSFNYLPTPSPRTTIGAASNLSKLEAFEENKKVKSGQPSLDFSRVENVVGSSGHNFAGGVAPNFTKARRPFLASAHWCCADLLLPLEACRAFDLDASREITACR
jgi:hypothetical protein